MAISLGPGKFCGTSLPRPRIHTDVKLNDERVDPPVPVLDPLMSWTEEAHWSMGGLNCKRLRLQGGIEGNLRKLQDEFETSPIKSSKRSSPSPSASPSPSPSPSPPPAPFAVKRRRWFVVDEDDDESEEDKRESVNGGLVRKLLDDFERVAEEDCGLKMKDGVGISTRLAKCG